MKKVLTEKQEEQVAKIVADCDLENYQIVDSPNLGLLVQGFNSNGELVKKLIGHTVPEIAKNSKFGCRNCLWNCVECQDGSMYVSRNRSLLCDAYAYCD